MGNGFFTSWALWEKMTFVLACGIVITVFAGGIKVWINHRKLRKYSKLPSARVQQAGDHAAEIPFTKDIEAHSGNSVHSVPFGIRAIESGIEVEGIWISRSNSPASLDSRASSPAIGKHDVSFDKDTGSNSNLLQPKPIRPTTRPSYPSSLSSVTAVSDTMVGSEKHGSRASSIYLDMNKHELHRPSRASFVQEQVRVRNLPCDLSFLDNIAPEINAPDIHDLKVPKARSFHTVEDVKGLQHYGKKSFSHPITTMERASCRQSTSTSDLPATHEDGDLGLLDKHRLSQVASMGELTPRSRISSFAGQSTDANHNRGKGSSGGYFDQVVSIENPGSSTSLLRTPRSAYVTMESDRKKTLAKGITGDEIGPQDPAPQASSQSPSQRNWNDQNHMLRRVNSGFTILKSAIAKSDKESESVNEHVEHKRNSKEFNYLPERLPRKLQKKAKKTTLRVSYAGSA